MHLYSLQQWHTGHADMPPMFMAIIRKEIGYLLRVESSLLKGENILIDGGNPY